MVDPLVSYDELDAAGYFDEPAESDAVPESSRRRNDLGQLATGKKAKKLKAQPIAKPKTSWTAAELMAVTFPEPKWAVPGILAEGANLLAGAPKLGKSWLALNLGVAIASGGMALGCIPVDAGDVFYLALEDTGRRLQSRLRAVLGEHGTPPGRLRMETVCEPLVSGGYDRINTWLEAHPDARLVIVDVLTKVRGLSTGNGSRYEEDYGAMSGLKELADRHGVAFLIVHHTRKADSDDFVDLVSGTAGLAGSADAVLVLSRSRGAAGAVLKVTGRDVEETEVPLSFDAQCGTWRKLDGPAADYEIGDTRRSILRIVRDEGPMTPKEIAVALSANYELIKKTTRRMASDGQLDTDGSGTYFDPLSPVPAVPLSLSRGQEGPEGHHICGGES